MILRQPAASLALRGWLANALVPNLTRFKTFRTMRRAALGFTLMELVITFVVIGVLSAVVIINFNAKTEHGVITQADELRRNLSHIQLLAISQGVRLKLSVTADGYAVCHASDACSYVASPAINGDAITDPATGLKFNVPLTRATMTMAPPSPLYFDTLGRPVTNASGIPILAPDTTIALTGTSGNQSASVTVLAVTGFAQAH
jgi:MSHA pilin protein MshC